MNLENHNNDRNIDQKSRCFVHIANSLVWRAITGEAPLTVPFTAKEHTRHGLPWFEYYSDNSVAVDGSEKLDGVNSRIIGTTIASLFGSVYAFTALF